MTKALVAGAMETTDEVTLTSSEQEFVTLIAAYEAELESYFSAYLDFDSSAQREQVIDDGEFVDPGQQYIPRLLEFEASHRGEDVGLLALNEIFIRSAGTARMTAPATVGRGEAATRLTYYQQNPLLPVVAKRALSWKPQVYEPIYSLGNSPALAPHTRERLRLYVAIHALEARDNREWAAKRVERLRTGGEPSWARELENKLLLLDAWPSADTLNERYNEAIQTLEELAGKSESPRLLETERVGNHRCLIRVADELFELSVAQVAQAALFEARRLVVGARAPDLEVTLLDGSLWRMRDQLGKVVVIQFSFTGCGPCESMYPVLADLSAEYPERLEILTLLRDEKPDHGLQATKDGKFTWSIAQDGWPGRITTKWSVSSFPTVYIVDSHGKIARKNASDKEKLRQRVSQLIEQAKQDAVD
ncbi:MAG: TlpA disulfide reductase family protein [Planctomycetota bacterium]